MSLQRRDMRLTIPKPPLSDGHIVLTPLTHKDAEEIATVCDIEGFSHLDAQLVLQVPQVDSCQFLRFWAISRAGLWSVDFDLPPTMIQSCFGVHEDGPQSRLMGIVGFNLLHMPHGSPDRVNVYYWTTPTARGKDIAPDA